MFRRLFKWLRQRRVLSVLGILAALALIFFMVDCIIMPLYTRQGSERAIPVFTGLTIQQAKVRADSAHFVLVAEPAKQSSEAREGMIIEQKPAAGSLAKPGRTVRLVPASAAPADRTPDVVGLDVREAQIRCRNAKLVCSDADIYYRFSALIPKGAVLAQDPKAGLPVKTGAAVKLTVSLGTQPDHFFVPYMMEKQLHEARILLREAGLKLGRIVRKETERYTSGTVIAQSARSGDEVPPETAIDLVIAIPVRSAAQNDTASAEVSDTNQTQQPPGNAD